MKSNNNPVLVINNLSKRYSKSIGGQQHHTSLKEALSAKLGINRNKSSVRNNNTFWALRNINLKVNSGEVLGIVGRNGSGKSTLLKLITKVITPTEGTIEIRGKLSSLIEVGAGFHQELTGRENVYFNGAILGMKKEEIDEKLQDIHEFSGIGSFFDTPVKHYSSGMYVRLAFSVAVHVDPEILIIDEVLAVGDYEFRKKSEAKIRSFLDEGKTVLLVSHSGATIKQLCSRAIMLEKGKIVADGKPAYIIKTYSGE